MAFDEGFVFSGSLAVLNQEWFFGPHAMRALRQRRNREHRYEDETGPNA